MAIYAVGDLQGCFDKLEHFDAALKFDPRRDRLVPHCDSVEAQPTELGHEARTRPAAVLLTPALDATQWA